MQKPKVHNFSLTQNERSELYYFLEDMLYCEDGVTDDVYIELYNNLSPDEINQLRRVYNFLGDEYTYPRANSRMLSDEMPLLYNLANSIINDYYWDIYDRRGRDFALVIDKLSSYYE